MLQDKGAPARCGITTRRRPEASENLVALVSPLLPSRGRPEGFEPRSGVCTHIDPGFAGNGLPAPGGNF